MPSEWGSHTGLQVFVFRDFCFQRDVFPDIKANLIFYGLFLRGIRVVCFLRRISEPTERIIDSASFDIDGDGILEDCNLADGPASGLFTVVMTASVNGNIKYKNTFNLAWGELSFGELDGSPCIVRKRAQDPEPKTEYLPLSVREGRIVIEGLDPVYEGYWGDSDWKDDRKE